MTEKNRRNILILDPERDTAELFARALETHGPGWKCYWARTSREAESLLCEMAFHFLLADFSTLQEDHFLLLEAFQEGAGDAVVIVHAYLNQKDDIQEAIKKGAQGYFIKPIMINSLRKLIDDFAPPQPA